MTGFLDDLEQHEVAPELVYESVRSFVNEHLASLLERRLQGAVMWCPAWHEHPEVVDRLTALWRAWEHLHDSPPTGLSTWWLHHADPHLAVIMDADTGPFVACRKGHAGRHSPLPIDL